MMRTYTRASPMISSRVPIQVRTGLERSRNSTVRISADARASTRETARERFISFMFFAPNCWAMRMENPWVSPEQTPRLIQLNQSEEPRAARAFTPTTCPTTAVSTSV